MKLLAPAWLFERMDATCEEIRMGAGVDVIYIYVNTCISAYMLYL